MSELIQNYLNKMGLVGHESYELSEANKLMNENVISFYKNRISLRENRAYKADEIAEKLAFVEENFRNQFKESWEREFGEDT